MRRAFRLYQGDGKGVTQPEFAERVAKRLRRESAASKASVSQATISRWLNGKAVPDELAVFAVLADELGVRKCWLAFGEEPMLPPDAGVLASAADAASPPPARPRRG